MASQSHCGMLVMKSWYLEDGVRLCLHGNMMIRRIAIGFDVLQSGYAKDQTEVLMILTSGMLFMCLKAIWMSLVSAGE